jgi:hypothetical protein
MEHFEGLQRCLAELPTTACDPAASYQPFDQSISRGDGAIGAALQEATVKAERFAIACIATNPVTMTSPPSSSAASGGGTAPKPAGFTSTEEAAGSAVSAVTALYALLVAVRQASPYMENGSGMLVSPQWLRNVVAFVRTLGTDLSLLLQTAAAMHSATPASSGKDRASAGSLQECLGALQALSSPPLAASALLGKYVEVVAQILLDTLGKFAVPFVSCTVALFDRVTHCVRAQSTCTRPPCAPPPAWRRCPCQTSARPCTH